MKKRLICLYLCIVPFEEIAQSLATGDLARPRYLSIEVLANKGTAAVETRGEPQSDTPGLASLPK